jgi:hypothetical protein
MIDQFIYDIAIHSLRKDITKMIKILKELKEIDGVGGTVEQLVREIKENSERIRLVKRDHGRKTWNKNQ